MSRWVFCGSSQYFKSNYGHFIIINSLILNRHTGSGWCNNACILLHIGLGACYFTKQKKTWLPTNYLFISLWHVNNHRRTLRGLGGVSTLSQKPSPPWAPPQIKWHIVAVCGRAVILSPDQPPTLPSFWKSRYAPAKKDKKVWGLKENLTRDLKKKVNRNFSNRFLNRKFLLQPLIGITI